ncbi:DNA-binding transcriptional regulator, MarR family [Jatrophihabitans endophyticus]|uniref:DNA-binding transcriptional regulator, MarR family n=1 Tax=Jatrophihabitans endophyticus TaxID=1206085 RepID=A0A1M5DNK9_9ACTN|nr:DNA-binding transcriptional regulator, MarR family [Jatrophihabitans endophyticus]
MAFRLAQLGAVAAEQFGERVAELELSRPQAGLLRLIGRRPGQSQRAVAAQLGTPPSRLVALLDDLERRDLLERRRNPDDRRNHELHLTPAGERTLDRLGVVAADHEAAVTVGLSAAERTRLDELLGRLAAAHGLAEGVHPGYRRPD